MNLIKRFFYRNAELAQVEPSIASPSSIDSEPLRLHIYQASGGTIIETRVYDRIKDRSKNSLYVIRDDQSLGQEIEKIITYSHLGN